MFIFTGKIRNKVTLYAETLGFGVLKANKKNLAKKRSRVKETNESSNSDLL